ncbi:MAG: hypothetical protein LQ347_003579, partial [Umbilicaria vellea]
MAKAKTRKTLAEQIADLDDPTPKDIDPEEQGEVYQNGDNSNSEDDGVGNEADGSREHYVDVGYFLNDRVNHTASLTNSSNRKSKLRKSEDATLGPQYAGSRISRGALIAGSMEDDPFGSSGSEQEGSGISDYADPEDFQLEDQVIDDEDIDSNEAFGEGDEVQFKSKGFVFRGSKATRKGPMDVVSMEITLNGEHSGPEEDSHMEDDEDGEGESNADVEELEDVEDLSDEDLEGSDHSEGASEEASDLDSSDRDTQGNAKAENRAELLKMMAEEQKTVAATISQAAKADAEKGRAVKQQRSTFDSLLNTRIRLQKALIASNSLSAPSSIINPSEGVSAAVQAAEAAALKLWSTLDSLRQSLAPPSDSKKRPFDATVSTPTSALWTQMETHESTVLPTRRSTLTKWSSKVHLATALPTRSKFANTPSHQPLTAVLDEHLSSTNTDRLIKRTRIPRSCAPIQAQSTTPAEEDPAIYDDADFYTLLLRELVDQRMADSNATTKANNSVNLASLSAALPTAAAARREAKVKKRVDTKA